MFSLIVHPETGLIVALSALVNVNLLALTACLLRQDRRATVVYHQGREVALARASMTRSKVVLMRPAQRARRRAVRPAR